MIIKKGQITLISCLIAFIFIQFSCKHEKEDAVIVQNKKKSQNSSEVYIDALKSKIMNFISTAISAAEDKVIDSTEADDLNNRKKNIDEFQIEIDKNFENNPDAHAKIEEFYNPANEIILKYNDAMGLLVSCRGAEKLQF